MARHLHPLAAIRHGDPGVGIETDGEAIGLLRARPENVGIDVLADEPGDVGVRGGAGSARAAAVYDGIAEPLLAEDIADCVAWAATRPHHVNIDRLVVRPLAQAANHKIHRVPPPPSPI